jgi:5-formyltetrahydrofolate cyclo-ligase
MHEQPALDDLHRHKQQLRRTLRARRRALDPHTRQRAAQALVRAARAAGWWRRYRHIGLYWPQGSELDVLPLLNALLAAGKTVYLPRLPPARQRRMTFVPITPHTRLGNNRYGIPECRQGAGVPATRLDVIGVPLLGFDRRGYRLGQGGGFYDATLAYRRWRPRARRPHLIGLAYAMQQVDVLPAADWDVRLDAILAV